MWLCPWRAMENPDPWQRELLSQLVTLRCNIMLCCSSQVGKTEAVAVAAYLVACLGFYVLVVSPSDRQSVKFHMRLLEQHARLQLANTSQAPNKHELWLETGGRVEAVPNSAGKVRGIAAVDLVVVDEASRVPDELYSAVTRMTAVSGGKLALLSTPFGKRGFFYREWKNLDIDGKPVESQHDVWSRHRVPWTFCPRIPQEHVDAERRRMGQAWVNQEYLDCVEGDEFLSASSGVFDSEEFSRLIDANTPKLVW